jgi:DNA-binding MarR family transcriptional regulator
MGAEGSALPQERTDAETTPIGSVRGRAPETEALELDRIIHERVRLGIVSSLAVNGWMPFTDLRDILGITDGNLSAHAKRLEEAGYLATKKSHDGRTSKTEYGLTAKGRKELQAYLDHMEAIIQATRGEGDR